MNTHIGIVVDNNLDNDTRVLKEIQMFLHLDFKVTVLCFSFKGEQYQTHSQITVERIKISRRLKNYLYYLNALLPFYRLFWKRHISKFISKHQPQILHVHDLYMSQPAYKALNKFSHKIPFVLDLHENYPVAYSSYNWTSGRLKQLVTNPKKWKIEEKKYLSYPDGLILLSENYKKQLLLKYTSLTSKSILVLPNIPDLNIFNKPQKLQFEHDSNKTTFLYFGRIGKRRGIFQVIDAFSDLVKNNINIKLLLIGPVDKSDKKTFFKKLEMLPEDKFEYIPWIELADLPSYMKISHVGLAPFDKNPQHDSGIANKVFQYMYGKLALLVSNCRPQQELVEKEQLGLVFTSHSDLKRAILKLYKEQSLRQKMGQNAYNTLITKFNIENFLPKVDKFIKQLYA